MQITERWVQDSKPTVSFELFPARSEKGVQKLEKVIDKLAAVQPDFMSVTFGAGGSTREGSFRLVERLVKEKQFAVLPYIAGFGMGPDAIASTVQAYVDLGIESLLAVRGDPPEDLEGFSPHPKAPAHGSDLIAMLKERFNFCLGAAGYPEGHVAAVSKEKDLEFLKLKIERGASFVIANYFYDNEFYFDFVRRAKAAGITVPILPGVMPIYNIKMMENLASLCGATITDEVRAGIAALPPDDKAALNNFGVDFAVRQCTALIKGGAPGVHIYTMDRAKSAVAIVKKLRMDGVI